MAPPANTKSLPSGSFLLALALVAYYLLVYIPLSKRAELLDRPLVSAWARLAATNHANRATAGLNLDNAAQRLKDLQGSTTGLEALERLVRQRLELIPEVRNRMAEPFQLIDFQNERLRRIEQLAALAHDKGVAIEAGVTGGLPEYIADMPQPGLLWPRLDVATQVLLSAIHAKVTTIKLMTQIPTSNHRTATDNAIFLHELPMRVEMSGPMASISRFLASLPLRGDELKATGLEALTNKPALFIDQILLRKEAPDKPQDVALELTLCSFVPFVQEVVPTEDVH